MIGLNFSSSFTRIIYVTETTSKYTFFSIPRKQKKNLQVVSAASGKEMLKTQNGEHGEHGEQVERSLSRFQLYYT